MKDKRHLSELKQVVSRNIGYLKEQDETHKDIRMRILDFFKENPRPTDNEVHGLADELGINEHDFEEHIYAILGDIFAYGRANEKGFTEDNADPEQLRMGIKVEMEHTRCPQISKRIALDHLAELGDYYTRLAKMEEEGGVED